MRPDAPEFCGFPEQIRSPATEGEVRCAGTYAHGFGGTPDRSFVAVAQGQTAVCVFSAAWEPVRSGVPPHLYESGVS